MSSDSIKKQTVEEPSGDRSFGLLAQSLGNGGGNSGSVSAGLTIPQDPSTGSFNQAKVSVGLEGGGDRERFRPLLENLLHHDWFMVAADFDAYWQAQRRADAVWADPDDWMRRAVLNVAPMGWFSSDRTIRGYARDVWQVDPVF